jgi:ADP-dependent NAD(P)H-hydrate dehydratase / NAD(P)H-hydrate epimerase
MKIVTGEQMRRIDQLSQEMGITTLELMENAGRAVAEAAAGMLPENTCAKITLICGKGNNGGDGLVAARLLKNQGFSVQVFLIAQGAELKGAPARNLQAARNAGVAIVECPDAEAVAEACSQADLVVDALLGTGVKGPVEGIAAAVINALNYAGSPILSVDIPSGVKADTGEIECLAVQASVTLTLGLLKWGLLFYPGRACAGRVLAADIGLPGKAIAAVAPFAESLGRAAVAELLPRREPDAHKGACGRVLVIAGSVGYTGAAALASLAALRMGAGLVTLAIPESLNDVMEMKLTEVITRPMPETPARSLAHAALFQLLALAEKSDAVIIGPGLSLQFETALLVRDLVGQISRPMVLDADALTALSEDISILEHTFAPVICTPHLGEMSRLVGLPISQVRKNSISLCRRLAGSICGVTVLKGATTLIGDGEGSLRVNTTGNPGMASAGTGDVLTGMIGGLLAQKMTPFDAASAGAYLHGIAGDLAAAEKGIFGMIASDVLAQAPAATLRVLGLSPDGGSAR